MKRIAFIGECMIELNGEPFGTMQQRYGGDTLNSATYLARVSDPEQIQVNYLSALGTDRLSQGMLKAWQADKINTDWVLIDENRQPGLYLVQLDKSGERSFLYWRNQSAARYLLQHPNYPAVLAQLSAVDMIYLSGISLAILPVEDRIQLLAQLQQLKTQGIEIAFDSNFRLKLWDSFEQVQQCYAQLLPLVDLALVTFDDEQLLWNDRDERQTLQRLSALGVKTVVVKQGKFGASFYHQQQVQQVPAQVVQQVVDTTSAGDAFNAGFLNGYLRHKPLVQCCQQGNQLASIVIQHKGAIIAPEYTQHLIKQFN